MSDTKIVRIEVEKSVWNKVKAKASIEDMPVKDYASKIFKEEVQDMDIIE